MMDDQVKAATIRALKALAAQLESGLPVMREYRIEKEHYSIPTVGLNEAQITLRNDGYKTVVSLASVVFLESDATARSAEKSSSLKEDCNITVSVPSEVIIQPTTITGPWEFYYPWDVNHIQAAKKTKSVEE